MSIHPAKAADKTHRWMKSNLDRIEELVRQDRLGEARNIAEQLIDRSMELTNQLNDLIDLVEED